MNIDELKACCDFLPIGAEPKESDLLYVPRGDFRKLVEVVAAAQACCCGCAPGCPKVKALAALDGAMSYRP